MAPELMITPQEKPLFLRTAADKSLTANLERQLQTELHHARGAKVEYTRTGKDAVRVVLQAGCTVDGAIAIGVIWI